MGSSRSLLSLAYLAKSGLCVKGNKLNIMCSFWSYELSKRLFISEKPDAEKPEWMTILFCGGIAGVVTWASVFPLGMIDHPFSKFWRSAGANFRG